MRNIVLFDLDGTLFDTSEGIIKCVKYALSQYGITEEDEVSLKRFIGPPLHQSFCMFYGFEPEKGVEATKLYRDRYKDKGVFECEPYEGIADLLRKLKGMGAVLGVATSKPEVFANMILEKFGIARYFTEVTGSLLDNSRSKKSEVIEEELKRLGADREQDRIIMVGDREHDIFGAKEKALESIGVYYGFANKGELESAGADHVVNTVEELDLLLTHIINH